ncbi:MAG: hypothetical protein VB064_00715 [Oscillospiraceae bacterium]|nr:hypothetical protein [Oscillospiraceae bacterium]
MSIEITGSYPIILDGETTGELTVTREGLFWSFEARCEQRNEIVRLSVYGDGKEGYLGIMEPFGDMLKLNRKLSRSALKDFPEIISHAGQRGELEYAAPETPDTDQEAAEAPRTSSEFPLTFINKANCEPQVPPKDDKPPPEASYYPPTDISGLEWRPCAVPCSLFSGLREKRICGYITGAYIAQDNDVRLLAVPEEIAYTLPDTEAIQFTDQIFLLDKIYLVCKIKEGKSVSEF